MANPLLRMPAPRVLRKQVLDSAPWLGQPAREIATCTRPLAALVDHPLGWWRVLSAAKGWSRLTSGNADEHADYLALCLATHHASVATWVPTDVDSKIRGHLWRLASTPRQLDRLVSLLISSWDWHTTACSARDLDTDAGTLSGHDGERLAATIGAYAQVRLRGNPDTADALQFRIEAELTRQATAWQTLSTGSARRRLIAAAIITHNAGDVDQGLSYWPDDQRLADDRYRWQRLAHVGPDRFDGAFAEAALWYKRAMSADGHRHYPLRDLTMLRRHPDLLLPPVPFLEQWGATLSTHPSLTDQRDDLLAGLIAGCISVPGGRAYQRALRGWFAASPSPDGDRDRLAPPLVAALDGPEIAPLSGLSDDEFDATLLRAANDDRKR